MYQSVSKWAVSTLIVTYNKLVYPPELQDFVLIWIKKILGEDPRPHFQAELFEPVL